MARHASLAPRKDPAKNLWVISLPKSLSSTGKRQREYFRSKVEAEKRSEQLHRLQDHSARVVRQAGPELIKAAVNYNELFQSLYGFDGGLAEACEAFMKRLDTETSTPRFSQLLDAYERDNAINWKPAYATKWRWFRKHADQAGDSLILELDSHFWVNWLGQRTQREGWSDGTFNEVASMLSSVWKHAVAQDVVERNPVEGVKRRKIRRQAKPVYTVEQVRGLMNTAWEHDCDMVPYFAIAVFAGLRPDSEIPNLTWENVDFDEGWIRVAAHFENKTETKRFVPIEDNLRRWLTPWTNARGRVTPTNFVRRRQWITRGRYQALVGVSEKEWTELVPYGEHVRDITRHTYGSYLEAKYRDRNIVKENMGHTDFRTYEQHYRNARPPKEAELFWALVPPRKRGG